MKIGIPRQVFEITRIHLRDIERLRRLFEYLMYFMINNNDMIHQLKDSGTFYNNYNNMR